MPVLQATPANWPNNHESIGAKGWAFILPTVTKEDADKVLPLHLMLVPVSCIHPDFNHSFPPIHSMQWLSSLAELVFVDRFLFQCCAYRFRP